MCFVLRIYIFYSIISHLESRVLCVIFSSLKFDLVNLRTMSNPQSNKEKLFINNGKDSLADDMSDASIQDDDKIQKDAASADITGSTEFQVVHSPSRSVRRCYSNTSNEDQFQTVTHTWGTPNVFSPNSSGRFDLELITPS